MICWNVGQSEAGRLNIKSDSPATNQEQREQHAMAATKVTVVICQAQGRNPVKRQMEEDILTALIAEPGVDASLVPHL